MKPYYDHGGIQIFHGDCREVLPSISADVLVSDPPYGIKFSSSWEGKYTGNNIAGDCSTVLRNEILDAWGDKPAIVFGHWRQAIPARTVALLVWNKGIHVGMGNLAIPWKPNHEFIFILGGGFSGHRGSGVLDFPAMSPNFVDQWHPTEKPEGLLKELVGKCPPGTVIDPFMGSGTTLRAAKELGRRAIGIEIEERYCEIAAKRLSQEVFDFQEVQHG